MPAANPLGNHFADEVVVDDFADLVATRRRTRELNVQVDVDDQALLRPLLEIVDANANLDHIVPQENAATEAKQVQGFSGTRHGWRFIQSSTTNMMSRSSGTRCCPLSTVMVAPFMLLVLAIWRQALATSAGSMGRFSGFAREAISKLAL